MSVRAVTHVNVSGEVPVVLDELHLTHSTFGDRALRAEIIMLFRTQLEQNRSQIEAASDEREWRFVMHTLKGAAAAVGAKELAQLAANWEAQGVPVDPPAKIAVLGTYDRAKQAFCRAAGVSPDA